MLRKNWIYHRGYIYFEDLGQPRGSIQGGKRPVVVVQNDIGNRFSPTVSISPITSVIKKPDQPTHYVFYPKFSKNAPSMVMAEQTHTINKSDIISYMGKMSAPQMKGVDRAVKNHFGFLPW